MPQITGMNLCLCINAIARKSMPNVNFVIGFFFLSLSLSVFFFIFHSISHFSIPELSNGQLNSSLIDMYSRRPIHRSICVLAFILAQFQLGFWANDNGNTMYTQRMSNQRIKWNRAAWPGKSIHLNVYKTKISFSLTLLRLQHCLFE